MSARARFINLLLTSTMVGNELAGGLTIHPALRTLPPQTHLLAEQALVRRYLRVMTPWQAAVLASYVPLLLDRSLPPRRSYGATWASFCCILLMLAITFARNLPLDLEVLRLAPPTAPPSWRRIIDRWDRWHMVRNACNIAALSLLLIGILSEQDNGQTD